MGKKVQELEEQLEARTLELELSNAELERYKAEISELKKRTDELSDQIKEFRNKEQAISWALTEAKAAEKRIISEAQSRIAAMEEEARAKAKSILEDAEAAAARTVKKAEASVLEYENNIKRLNSELAKAASDAREQAEKFADLILQIKPAVDSEIIEEMKGYGAFSGEANVELPDDYRSPAELMQNIYKIQGRELSVQQAEEETEGEQADFSSGEPEKVWRVEDLRESDELPAGGNELDLELNSIIEEVLKEG